MKELILSRGDIALVDDEDYEFLNQWKWYKSNDGYATRCAWTGHGYKRYYMHRVVANTPIGMFTDHINLDRLDNRRSNLRICTLKQNLANRPPNRNNTSGKKGVSWHHNKWNVCISMNNKSKYIGAFKNIDDAVNAYNNAAKDYMGEFAYVDTQDNALQRNELDEE